MRRDGTAREILSAPAMYTTYLGGHMEYAVECAVGELFVIDQRVESPIAAGAAVSITSRLRRDGRAARPLSACPARTFLTIV